MGFKRFCSVAGIMLAAAAAALLHADSYYPLSAG